MKTTKIFVPIYKVDAAQRLVYGRLTDETVDLANEIMDYETSKPHFEKWSEHAEKVSGGKSKGNLRAMHGPTAAGKFTDIIFDDEAKSIDVVGKVVDDQEWKKVVEGVYTGYSLGGNIIGKMWKDEATGANRYTVAPIEGSLVDLPCNPNANFDMIKVAGAAAEKVAFKVWAPSNSEIAAKAEDLAKAAGTPDKFGDFFEAATTALVEEHTAKALEAEAAVPVEGEQAPEDTPAPAPEAAQDGEVVEPAPEAPAEPEAAPEPAAKAAPFELVQVHLWKTSDGSTFEKKGAAKQHQDAIDLLAGGGGPLADGIAKALAAAGAEPAPEAAPVDIAALGLEVAKRAAILTEAEPVFEPHVVTKGLYEVGCLARLMSEFGYICASSMWETEAEGDASQVPAMLMGNLKAMGETLIAMADEEVAELVENLTSRGVDLAVLVIPEDSVYLGAAIEATKANTALIEKVGARNSKKDAAKIQATHDHMAELGAKCAEGAADKAALPETIAKTVQALTAERDELKDQVEKALPGIEKLGETIAKMKGDLDEAQEKIKALEAGPAPMPRLHPSTKVAGKSDDHSEPVVAATEEDIAKAALEMINSMTPEQIQTAVFKAATSQRVAITGMVSG